MAILLPFDRATFAREMKPKISGNNLTLEFDNIKSMLDKIAVEFYDYFSRILYEKIVQKTAAVQFDGSDVAEETITALNAEALDYLQRAMLHFALYQQVIYLLTNIGNNGITVKKSDTETTIFKYQQDQLENKLIADGWFWLNQLLALLNANAELFPDWNNSTQQQELADLPVALADFEKWVGVRDEVFMLFARWIIREVWNECVLSRIDKETIEDKEKFVVREQAARALCYDVMARACQRLAYHCLPEPIRLDINNEMGKNHAAQADKHIREKVANIFAAKAQSYWTALDAEIYKKKEEIAIQNVSTEFYQPKKLTQKDKFYFV
ncbi:MAG: hypothetical protein LBB53_06780 [Prevotellaceae bacterium]|jgi:hypothetical protein|nr:hypothetical protein [Prevotellaceae bacterium]